MGVNRVSRDTLAAELRDVERELTEASARVRNDAAWSALDRLQQAAGEVGQAWSGSSIGFHSRVYYADLEVPPAGAHFSQEWGFIGVFQGTRGDWREYRFEDVVDVVLRRAGNPDTAAIEKLAGNLRKAFEAARARVQSVLSIASVQRADAYLASVDKQVNELAPLTIDIASRVQLPRGAIMSRDTTALAQGVMLAPHQEVLARVVAARSSVSVAEDLAALAGRAADHLARQRNAGLSESEAVKRRVFIGHGQSPLWRELKDFVADRLGLDWDEFNRTPTAGLATSERLEQMLDEGSFALLVLTAEDQRKDGTLVARQNVIHEAGLFQGRLGWRKAIILLEEGCEEFSNIEGLGQIRFPKGRIDAAFEKVREVLEREGLLAAKTRKT
jgi:predicted nucleotide-binding protein